MRGHRERKKVRLQRENEERIQHRNKGRWTFNREEKKFIEERKEKE